MAGVERMTVIFPEPMAESLRAAVESGDYATTDEAIRDAVGLWSERRAGLERDNHKLRQAWDAGKASGSAGSLDMAKIIREAEADFEEQEYGKRA